jgi:hypothetical protein
MDNLWEVTLFADQAINRVIEAHGKPVTVYTNHFSGNLNGIVESKQRKSDYYRLPNSNPSRCPNKQSTSTNILDHIPVSSIFYSVLSDDIGSPARILALIRFGIHFSLIFSRSLPEHLNVTTRLAARIASSPVAGLRPFRSRLSFTQNLPNPLTNTSSPDSRVDLIISSRVSVISTD